MTRGQRIRKIWHDFFYSRVSAQGVDFALKCQEVAGHVDVPRNQLSFRDRFRFFLHLSLCQACKNYSNFSKGFRRHLKPWAGSQISKSQVQIFNKKLLEKYRQKNQSKNP